MLIRYKITENAITVKDFVQKEHELHCLTQSVHSLYLVNNERVNNYYLLKANDILDIIYLETADHSIVPIKHAFTIVYEDSYLLIIAKECDVATIPTKAHYQTSLANYIAQYYLEKGIIGTIHFVNRLDLATSGLVIVAKNGYVAGKMAKTPIIKKYLLEVEGTDLASEGTIETAIVKRANSMKRENISDQLPNALTKYQVIAKTATTLVEATLLTGKTHQLRVHFASLNQPIMGDKLYGKANTSTLHLHSYYCSFTHPITQQKLEFTNYPSWISPFRDQLNHN